MLRSTTHKDEWSHLQRLILCPEITSFERYLAEIASANAKTVLHVLTNPQPVPSHTYIRSLHHLMFGKIHPWAGQFNKPEQDVWFGGMLSCDPLFIESELALLQDQTIQLIDNDDISKARAIAFFYARFERIHPFLDGNGRVGRMLMDSQMISFWGLLEGRKPIDRFRYIAALSKAQRKKQSAAAHESRAGYVWPSAAAWEI